MMQRAKAAQKSANRLTMMERMQRADRIKDARKEMLELEAMMQGRDHDNVAKDALCVHETLSDGLQALQQMMDGDERDECERRGDKLAATTGGLILGAVDQLKRATELFDECCDEDGYVCDVPNVPNTQEIAQMTETADVWGMCTVHTADYMCTMHASGYAIGDTDAEADRHDDADNLDKTAEAYEEMVQHEMQHHCTN